MKKNILCLLSVICFLLPATAQTPVLQVVMNNGDTAQFKVTDVDRVSFSSAADYLFVNYSGDKQKAFVAQDVFELTYGTIAAKQDISIVWNNDGTVTITNPMAADGVSVTANGADVVISSTYPEEVNYNLSGTSSDGSLRIYSDYKYQLTLLGLNLTNNSGAAICSQSKKKGTIKVQSGYTNTLTDGQTYANANEDEDEKACLFSEGQLVFKGAGTLNVVARGKHAIASDDYIEVEKGTLNLTTTANAAKGFKANDYINILGGTITITQSGNKVIEDGDVKYSAGLKADSTITISAGKLTINSSAEGGKGFNADKGIYITGGTLDINLTGSGGTYSQAAVDATATGGSTSGETSTSHTVYFYAVAQSQGGPGGGSSQWTGVKLYKADGTLVATLSTKAVSDYTAYYYTFPQGTTGSYYFTGTYTSRNSTYNCTTSTFSAPTSEDAYYRPGSYTTSGTNRTYQLTTWDPNAYQPGGGGSWGGSTTSDTQTFTCTCIKCDGPIVITGGTLTLNATGTKGTCGIKTSGDLTIGTSGATAGPAMTITTTGTYVTSSGSGMSAGYAGDPKGIKAEGDIMMYSGDVYITTSGQAGEGMESKSYIELAGGRLFAKAQYEDAINCSGIIKFSGAWVYAVSNGNDAIDSNYGRSGAITITDGVVVALTSAGSPEEGLDCDNNSYITISGGYVFSGGGSQGGGGGWGGSSSSASVGSASQGYCFTGSYAITNNNYYTVKNASGTVLFSIKALTSIASGSNSLSLISAPALTKSGTNTIVSGSATPTGDTAWDGYIWVGGTTTNTTSANTFTGK